MAQDTKSPIGRTPRWIKIALGVSLAANLAVAGMVAGAAVRGGPKGPPKSDRGGYAAAYIRALPREDRREIFEKSRMTGEDREMARTARRAGFEEMLAALRMPELDRDAVAAMLAKQQSEAVSRHDGVQDQWLDVVAGMTTSERLSYADAVEDAIKRPPPHERKP